MSDHLHPWAAVHHEDAPHDPQPAAEPAPAPKPAKPKADAKAGTQIPIAMALMVPPDLAAAITSLVETQAALTAQIGKLVESIGKLIGANSRSDAPGDNSST